MKDTHAEITRLDKEIKKIYEHHRVREEKKDTMICELKGMIQSLNVEMNHLKGRLAVS